MANTAGFAAALTIRQSALDDALLVAYASSSFPRTFNDPLLFGPPDGSIDLFLEPLATILDQDSLVIRLELWGRLSLIDAAGVTQDRGIHGWLDVQPHPGFSLLQGTTTSDLSLLVTLAASDLAVTGWTYEVIFGTSYPPDLEAFLDGPSFLSRIQQMLQLVLSANPIAVPPIPVAFVGNDDLRAALDRPSVTAAYRPGALMIGFDITDFTTPWAPTETISVIGDGDQLADFAGTYDVAAAIDPGAVPILMQKVETEVRTQVVSQGASLDSLVVTAADGQFEVVGSASKSEGSSSFSFAVVPSFVGSRPGYFLDTEKGPVIVKPREYAGLSFTTADIEVEDSASWWADILAVLLSLFTVSPIPLIYLGDLVGSEVRELVREIEGQSSGGPMARLQRIVPTDPNNVTVRIFLEEFTITPDGTFAGLTVTLKPVPAALIGPKTIPADLRSSALSYIARLPLGVMPDDRAVHIRWTVTDSASGTVLFDEDDVAAGRQTYTLVPEVVAPQASSLDVACHVYRAIGSEITETLSDHISLEVGPPLPSGAYVRWRYDVKNPQLQFDQTNQVWIYTGGAVVRRWSNLHRTDHPCQNASRHSRYEYEIDTLDTLPFPVAEIDSYRSVLCDYCFYGGPAGLRVSL